MPLQDACLLVASCDSYSDISRLTCLQLARMWPDCALKKYLIVNREAPRIDGVEPIFIGPDQGWSANLRRALASIPEAYVFLYIDDLFLLRPVDSRRVHEIIGWAMARGANYVRFHPHPKMPGTAADRSDIARVARDTPYRTATVMSFWRKECLHALLDPEENPWQFETRGSDRSNACEDFFSTKKGTFTFYNLVVKGKLRRRARSLLRQHGHDPAALPRTTLSWSADAVQTLKDLRARVFWHVPARYQKSIRAVFASDARFDKVAGYLPHAGNSPETDR